MQEQEKRYLWQGLTSGVERNAPELFEKRTAIRGVALRWARASAWDLASVVTDTSTDEVLFERWTPQNLDNWLNKYGDM